MFSLRAWATPITVGSFLISALSGVILFFHLNIGLMRPAHEWLSWFMILGVGMHLVINWRPFLQYFKRPIPLAVMGAFVLVTALSFMSLGGEQGSSKMGTAMKTMNLLQNAPISALTELTNLSADGIAERLTSAGIEVTTTDTSLADLAKSQDREAHELLAIITQ